MNEWLIGVLLLLAAVPALIAGVVYTTVMRLCSAGIELRPADRRSHPSEHRVVADHDNWATEQGFEWVGAYAFAGAVPMFIAAWQHAGHPTFFCLYCQGPKVYYDMVTIFSDKRALTTSNTKDAHMLPHAPGALVQSYPGLSPDALWDRHLEAEVYLTRQCHLQIEPLTKPFDQYVVDAIRRQMMHIRSLLFWPLRGPWWYFVTRQVMAGRSIQRQHEAGQVHVL